MPPRRFGRYEVHREIGDGAMGRVYRCFDPLMKRVVAIKTVKKEYLTRDTRDEYLRRFRREAQAAGRLSHPNIVSVFDVGDDYFVMEYLEGSTLQLILREKGQLPPEEALRILAPLAEALDYAHRSGIVHRDIKPGNVFVLADGRPKLMDFGVAHLESSAMTAQGHFFGSPSYMAPEQVSGDDVAAAADLFSFAVVAYEMITGHRPFEGASITAIMYRVVNEEAPAPRQWDFALPPVYDDIFRRALSKDPRHRFPDATSLVRALERREFTAPAHEAASARAAAGGGAGLATLDGAATRAPATTTAHPVAWAPLPPAAAGGIETYELSAGGSRTTAMKRPRRTLMAVAAVAAAGALGLYLGGGGEPPPAPPLPLGPAMLRIETEPAGASVWLDGKEAGRAPVAWPSVRPGVHKVRVAAEGYAPAGLTLVVRPGEPPPPLRFNLEPLTARLRVRSEPPGARVFVDGQEVGIAPLEAVPLSPGPHEVRLERSGFAPAERSVEARAGETLDVSLVLDSARPGPLPSPSPVVAGALVRVDDTVTRPLRIKGEAPPYPKAAERFGMQGSVTVDMLIDENGRPQDLRVVESASELLDRVVVDAIRRWRYEPARKNGVPVRVRIQHQITFQPRS